MEVISNVSIMDIAKAFLSIESMTHKKLQKLCYYTQAWHLALFESELFRDRIEAWVHGPVSPRLYKVYKNYGWRKIPRVGNTPNIDQDIFGFIKDIYDIYGDFSGDQLEHLTHDEDPWVEAREGLGELEVSNRVITHESMKNYYRNLN